MNKKFIIIAVCIVGFVALMIWGVEATMCKEALNCVSKLFRKKYNDLAMVRLVTLPSNLLLRFYVRADLVRAYKTRRNFIANSCW